MNPAERLQRASIKALSSQRDAIDSCCRVFLEAAALDRAWIGLERDFKCFLDRKIAARGCEHPRDHFGVEQTRRSSPEEYADQRTAADMFGLGFNVAFQRFYIAILRQLAAQRVRIEIAVRAFAYTPWEVHVER